MTTVNISTCIDINDVDVDVEVDCYDVLNEMSLDDILSYVEDEFGKDEIQDKLNLENELSDFDPEEIMNYLVDEYHRQSFADFPFEKFFAKIGKN